MGAMTEKIYEAGAIQWKMFKRGRQCSLRSRAIPKSRQINWQAVQALKMKNKLLWQCDYKWET